MTHLGHPSRSHPSHQLNESPSPGSSTRKPPNRCGTGWFEPGWSRRSRASPRTPCSGSISLSPKPSPTARPGPTWTRIGPNGPPNSVSPEPFWPGGSTTIPAIMNLAARLGRSQENPLVPDCEGRCVLWVVRLSPSVSATLFRPWDNHPAASFAQPSPDRRSQRWNPASSDRGTCIEAQ